MKWTKCGRIFDPARGSAWFVSHAALPVVEERGDHHRVYFSGRDRNGRSRIGYFEIDLERPAQILRVSEAAVLDVGPLGSFDDSGVTTSCLVTHQGNRYHYFTGWSRGVSVPFYLAIGLAVAEGGGDTLRRVSAAPVLGRTAVDPFLTASPWVRIDNGRWRMWYVSCSRWQQEAAGPKHYYHVRYAESADGILWHPSGTVCIDYASADEHAISRPCVVKDGDLYRMWYASRGASYRIGYAESADGLTWQRKDAEAGIDPSADGWDSEMVAYPCVVDHRGRRYMLYNGNRYGETGIGLAVLSP